MGNGHGKKQTEKEKKSNGPPILDLVDNIVVEC